MSSRTLFQTEEVALASYIAFEKRHHDRDFVFISQVVGAAFLSSGVCSSATTPLRFAMTSPPSGCQKDFHLRAVEHARHTRKKAGRG
jgi:hypothetical protein